MRPVALSLLLWGCGEGTPQPASPPPPAPQAEPPSAAPAGMARVAAGDTILGVGGGGRKGGASPGDGPAQALAPWQSAQGVQLPRKRVRVDAFFMDRTEVTRAAYAQFLVDTDYRPPHVDEDWAREGWNWTGLVPPPGTEDHPVVLVSWYDAQAYCAWADKRLPSEAEWQLAAFGPADASRRFPWGQANEPQRMNHGQLQPPNTDDSDGHVWTAPVGSYPLGATPDGLLDLFGNAWEFTADHRASQWTQVQATRANGGLWNPIQQGPGLYVAVRGGSYFFELSGHPGAEKHAFLPEIRRKTSGFRCARDA